MRPYLRAQRYKKNKNEHKKYSFFYARLKFIFFLYAAGVIIAC